MFWLKIFVFILFSHCSLAYIPPAEMVLSRLEKTQQGAGFKISQKVRFSEVSKFTAPLELIEVWLRGPQSVSLSISSSSHPGLQANFLYKKNGSKTWIDSQGRKRTKKSDFLETYFLSKGFLPEWMLSPPALRLGRAEGVVSYLFQLGKTQKKVWVEQDEFVIRKIQTESGRELSAFEYQQHSSRFLFPKKRKFKTPQYTAEMEVLDVKRTKGFKNKLKSHRWEHKSIGRDMDRVKEFYENIR